LLVELDSVRQALPYGFSQAVLRLTNAERRGTQGDDDIDGFLAYFGDFVSLDRRKERGVLLQTAINNKPSAITRASPCSD
jgi:hypothetical protein